KAAGTADAVTATTTYDSLGRLVAAADFRGSFYRTNYTYDGLGRRIRMDQQVGTETNPRVATTRWEYDLVGNTTAEIDPLGRRTEHVYTDRHPLIETRAPSAPTAAPPIAITRHAYDDAGARTRRLPPPGPLTR